MFRNTELRYSYLDAKGRRVHRKAVAYAFMRPGDEEAIRASLHLGKFFLPALIGLPADKKDGYGLAADTAMDPWFRLDGIEEVDSPDTSRVHASELAPRFKAMAGHWTEKTAPGAHGPRDYGESGP